MLLSQGINGLPVYDLNNCNYVITFGGNLLESSRNVIGYLGATAFMRRGRPQRGKLVSVHPRLSLTGVKADEWVPIRPGTYAALALGMANVIINSHCTTPTSSAISPSASKILKMSRASPTRLQEPGAGRVPAGAVSAITGVTTDIIARLAGEFATNRPAVAVMPTEPGELNGGNSLYTALAIHALNALVGSMDAREGCWYSVSPTWGLARLCPDPLGKLSLAQARLDGAGSPDLPLAASVYQHVARRILEDSPTRSTAAAAQCQPGLRCSQPGPIRPGADESAFCGQLCSTLDESAAHADLILPASTFLEVWGDDFIEGLGYPGCRCASQWLSRYSIPRPRRCAAGPGRRLGGPLQQALPW